MKNAIVCLIGLVFIVSVSAEPLLEGRVRLESGEPVTDAQVRIFDMSDLWQGAIARAQTDGTGYFALPLAALRGSTLPEGFALGPNYPNPFNPSTIIPYQLAASSQVRLEVFNLLGQHIATLVDGERPAGFHTATWHATDATGRAVGAGVYIYRMTVGVKHQTGRMVLIDGQAGVSAGGIAPLLRGASGGGGPIGESEEYGLIVSGSGLVPYVDSSFRVEAGMAPVELVVSAGLPSAGKATDEAVIPDAKLRSAIETALGKTSGTTITKGEMETLTILVARDIGISDLTGLEFATNLRSLWLGDNDITDLSPLAGLTNLTDLDLYNNNITDLSPLTGLAKLTHLTLSGNNITDLSPLAGLTNLTDLRLSDNNITDLSPLTGLAKLTHLTLKGNPLSASSINKHIPALQARGVTVQLALPVTIPDANLRAAIAAALGKASGATITTDKMENFLFSLEARDMGISDLTGLAFATNLHSLFLDGNNITDLSPLAGLTNLTDLRLSDNNITDLSPLTGLAKLTHLTLKGNPLSASSINKHIPALQARGVTVTFDPTPATITDDPTPATITDDPTPVAIPDANLRAAIEDALGKASGAPITVAEMKTLTDLEVYKAGISDLTGLAFATNLTNLYLSSNRITDLSPLVGLTNLTFLDLGGNRITDLSPLSGLTNLTRLHLSSNRITDISPLVGLTKLIVLDLESNRITDLDPLVLGDLTNLTNLYLGGNNLADLDLSVLGGLTRLRRLYLEFSNLADLSVLRGLTKLIVLDLLGNPLSVSSINDHIPALERSGVTVRFDPPFRESDFDIELVFLDDHFTESQKRVIRYAARRWMSIIREDLPDYTFSQGWRAVFKGQSLAIPSGERIDDLRIYVRGVEDLLGPDGQPVNGLGSAIVLRETHLSVLGWVALDLEPLSLSSFLNTALHEIGHVLGIGTIWDNLGFLQDFPGADPHFNGPLAIAAFNAAGGRDYAGAKVPVETDGAGSAGSHWRSSVLEDELMRGEGSGDALSAITIQALADLGYVVDVTQADPYTLSSATAKASAKVAAQSTHAEPKWSCGVGQHQEPIYVVDQQGRIVRTLGD